MKESNWREGDELLDGYNEDHVPIELRNIDFIVRCFFKERSVDCFWDTAENRIINTISGNLDLMKEEIRKRITYDTNKKLNSFGFGINTQSEFVLLIDNFGDLLIMNRSVNN